MGTGGKKGRNLGRKGWELGEDGVGSGKEDYGIGIEMVIINCQWNVGEKILATRI